MMACDETASVSQPGPGDGSDAGSDSPFVPDDSGLDSTCAWSEVTPERAGVDIVFVIDNSHSMRDEIEKTIANINAFSEIIASSGLDYQVIMLTAKGTNLWDQREDVPNLKDSGITGDMPIEVCVPPPLGVGEDGGCGDNPPRFYHLDHWPVGIASHNGMWMAISMYRPEYSWVGDIGPADGGWYKWARFDATKFFVMITDDEAEQPTTEMADAAVLQGATEPWEIFDRMVLYDPRFGPAGTFGSEDNRKYVYNTICGWVYPGGYETDEGACESAPDAGEWNAAVDPGEQHQTLAALTGGMVESICRDDWSAVLSNLADAVVATLGCEYAVPEPDEGVIDPDQVLVVYTPEGGDPVTLDRVTDISKCDSYPNGWYYDDNDSPTRVILCPDACATIGSSATGTIELWFGCEAPPPK